MKRSEDLATMFKVLSAETRVRILRLLRGRALCVGALAKQLHISQGGVSQHLRLLREAGLIIAEKRGYYVHYRVREEALAKWRRRIDGLFQGKGRSARVCRSPRKCQGAEPCARKNKAAKSPSS